MVTGRIGQSCAVAGVMAATSAAKAAMIFDIGVGAPCGRANCRCDGTRKWLSVWRFRVLACRRHERCPKLQDFGTSCSRL